MKIIIACLWGKDGAKSERAFQSAEYSKLAADYVSRIAHSNPCELKFGTSVLNKRPKSSILWICDPHAKGKSLATSEDIASKLQDIQNSGIKEFWIAIGGADGFHANDLTDLAPHYRWSFGPLTLPHELACVIACEQLYRGFTILEGHPYHLGH